MSIWLEYEVKRSVDCVYVYFRRCTGDSNKSLYSIEDCGCEKVNIGAFDSLEKLTKKIENAKFKLYKAYRSSEVFYNSVDNLCKNMSKGRKILEDSATKKLINKLTPPK